jgi:S1-C subfamily serine protease
MGSEPEQHRHRPAPGGQAAAGLILLLILLVVLLAGGAGAAVTWWMTAAGNERTADALAEPVAADTVPISRLTLAPLIARVAPAVVNIAVLQPSPLEQNPLLRDPYFRDFVLVPEEAQAPRISAGSGFVVDAERGLVITNRHVVDNARAIEVMAGDRRYEARLLAVGRDIDLAVLQIPARNLTAVRLGDSDRVSVGDYVVAIGDPFEIGQTVTAGIVSALGRSRRGGTAYVQTDAPINPGNSGGPLISMRGEVIGINTAIVGPGEGNVGIGLAIPSNVARRIIEQVRARSI